MVELVTQYYDESRANYGYGRFQPVGLFSVEVARRLNNVVQTSRSSGFSLIIASTFTIVEISRKWEEMVGTKFTEAQLYAFLQEPPTWFNLAPIDEQLTSFFNYVPNYNSKMESIEWTDAIHIATVLSRGDDPSVATLATTDGKLKQLLLDTGRVVL
jgi:hypothetical protein